MNLNTNNESSNKWTKYSDYELKAIGKLGYISPTENANKIEYDPFENIEQALIDIINLGKFATENSDKGEDIANKTLEFVKTYGLLGFMNDMPVNNRYLANEKVSFKANVPHARQKGYIKRDEYIASFFPKTMPSLLADNILYAEKLLADYTHAEDVDNKINDTFILAQDYHELWIYIVDYAESVYKLLLTVLDVKANGIWCANVAEELEKFELSNLRLKFDSSDELNLRWNITSLKQALDLTFALIATRDKNNFNICKHCKKVFIAKNPKAEYCTYSCKNQANVYKSRARYMSEKPNI